MVNFYLTQDKIGSPSGGGTVTRHEYRALDTLGGPTQVLDGGIVPIGSDPFDNDERFRAYAERLVAEVGKPRICHLYAGCFTRTVDYLKGLGARVTYTAAAHDKNKSIEEHQKAGFDYPFEHMRDGALFEKYLGGYKGADVLICPSLHSKRVMEAYGCASPVVIPHGVDPAGVPPMPKRFTAGYLGSGGPDKGLRYLLMAWRRLDLADATLLIAGPNVEVVEDFWRRYGGRNVDLMGYVEDVEDFYRRVSVYVQPSVTEGFGIEVLEAAMRGRALVVSDGAGACDFLGDHPGAGTRVAGGEGGVDDLARALQEYKEHPERCASAGARAREGAEGYLWPSIERKYRAVWEGLS